MKNKLINIYEKMFINGLLDDSVQSFMLLPNNIVFILSYLPQPNISCH